MAWRIHDSVIRGEIDNREKGIVRGTLWVDGAAEPIALELAGNACADIAGCLLKFKNPKPTVPIQRDAVFAPLQRGSIGDLTASRKVRVFDVPVEDAYMMAKRGEKAPEHMANCLYLEWFSGTNGRVVVESADYELEISTPHWRPTPEDESRRAQDAAEGWNGFLSQLDAALENQKRGAKDPEEDWDEHDYERFLKESDARTDKYIELLEKYGDSDEADEKIAEEMGWTRELTQEEAEEERKRIEELNAACEAALHEPPPAPDPHREGIDWIRTENGEIRHPLQHRAFESAMKFWHQCKELGFEKSEEDDLSQFIFEFQTCSVKLAGALDGIAEGHGPHDAAFTVAYLKRALDHLHKSQAGLENVAKKKLLPETLTTEARQELFEVREGILRLMQEFRDRNG
jgi:hypothetical protein